MKMGGRKSRVGEEGGRRESLVIGLMLILTLVNFFYLGTIFNQGIKWKVIK